MMPTAKQQLNELYLPLLMMQARGKRVFRMFLTLLKRTYVFGSGQLPQNEMNLWVQWTEHVFLPMNDQMVDLILKGQENGLAIGGQMPNSFHELIHYQQRYAAAHSRWVREGGQYQHPGNFPDGLERDILDAIGRLALETGWLPKMLT
jgi:hypothetical protein